MKVKGTPLRDGGYSIRVSGGTKWGRKFFIGLLLLLNRRPVLSRSDRYIHFGPS